MAVPVSTGAQALIVVNKFRPSLILLDLRMPSMDGEHFLGILKSEPTTASIPLIIISAQMNDAEANELSALGAVGTISKGKTTMPQLRELVNRFMGKPGTSAA